MTSILNLIKHYITSRPGFEKIVKNSGWLVSDRILRMVIGIVVGAWVARYLGTQVYGQLNLAQSYILLITPVLQLGLDNVVIHRLVAQPDKENQILGTTLILRVASASILLPLILAFIFLTSSTTPIINVLVSLLIIGHFAYSFEMIDYYFRAIVASKYTVIVRNIAYFTSSAFKIVAILIGADVTIFALIISVELILFVIGLTIAYYRSGKNILQWRFDKSLAISLLKTSYPLIIAGLATNTYMRIDQLMLANMLGGSEGETAVGLYAVAVRISELWYFVPSAIVISVFPVILETRANNYSLYLGRVQRLFNIMVFVSYLFGISVTLFARPIILVLYGNEYLDSVALVNILVWSGIWVSLGLARTNILHAEDQQAFLMWATGIGAICNIFMNWILIPLLGATGCAIATFLSYGISAYLTSFILGTKIGIMQTKALYFPNPFSGRSLK